MDKRDIQLSKSLSWLLRHGAEKTGLKLDAAGFVDVDDILKLKHFQAYHLNDIIRVQETNDKKRFSLKRSESGRTLKIRANQGHSLKVEDDALLMLMTESTLPHIVYHGTYFSKLSDIKSKGLSRMSRNHIHFTHVFPGEANVLSGVRRNCEVVVAVDALKAFSNGIKFYKSENSVILCPGDKDGLLKPLYIVEFWQLHPKRRIG